MAEVKIIDEVYDISAGSIYATYDPNSQVLEIHRETDEYDSLGWFLDEVIYILAEYLDKIASLNTHLSILILPSYLNICSNPEIIQRCRNCPGVKIEDNGKCIFKTLKGCHYLSETLQQIRNDLELIINKLLGSL